MKKTTPIPTFSTLATQTSQFLPKTPHFTCIREHWRWMSSHTLLSLLFFTRLEERLLHPEVPDCSKKLQLIYGNQSTENTRGSVTAFLTLPDNTRSSGSRPLPSPHPTARTERPPPPPAQKHPLAGQGAPTAAGVAGCRGRREPPAAGITPVLLLRHPAEEARSPPTAMCAPQGGQSPLHKGMRVRGPATRRPTGERGHPCNPPPPRRRYPHLPAPPGRLTLSLQPLPARGGAAGGRCAAAPRAIPRSGGRAPQPPPPPPPQAWSPPPRRRRQPRSLECARQAPLPGFSPAEEEEEEEVAEEGGVRAGAINRRAAATARFEAAAAHSGAPWRRREAPPGPACAGIPGFPAWKRLD
ncbi:serine/arginine repetitive matrix protein 1-like [Chroicocephalus ridibundus]|uniref:serine/arginine repetitive matrix protein 1-like n=1 Tax=Chroicocephalus ridibundus TaxID=1192867 RepID=UPI002FDD54B7